MNPSSKARRDRVLRETTNSLSRKTPDEVILRKLVNQEKYSLSGARNLLAEAKMRSEAIEQ